MNVMVAGFDADATRRLSNEIRSAGHQVLGALGRHGARTFLRALVPELVVIPTEDAARVREWTADLGLGGLVFMEVPQKAPDGAGQQVLRRFAGEPEPELKPVVVEHGVKSLFDTLEFEATPADPPPQEVPIFPVERPAPLERRGVTDETSGPKPKRRLREPSTAAPLPPPAEPREAHPDIVAKLAQVRFADYFQVLEVEPGGSPFLAREALERLARRFSPRGWPGRLTPEELDMLDEITRGVSDAALVLTDPDLRTRYERALSQGAAATRRGP